MTHMVAKAKLGRTRAVPPIAFRVTDTERHGLEALAAKAGCTVNAMARARAVAGLEPERGVTPSGDGVTPARDLTVEYDPEAPR